uniref:Uncharacterized protein n=1 Tax=Amphimedon queenslandica TaxID=400682 RepID=A0A1X7VKA6_AMPQE
MHTLVSGLSIGQHPLVTILRKVVFQTCPPLPRYQGTWDVGFVLHYTSSDTLNDNMSLKQLSLQTVMLLALTRTSRSAHLSNLSFKGYRNTPEGAVFISAVLAEQSRPEKNFKKLFFAKFNGDEALCPMKSLVLHIERTRELRGDAKYLFICFITPHKPVTSSTIARWLKQIMELAGIDTCVFKLVILTKYICSRGYSALT